MLEMHIADFGLEFLSCATKTDTMNIILFAQCVKQNLKIKSISCSCPAYVSIRQYIPANNSSASVQEYVKVVVFNKESKSFIPQRSFFI